MVLQNRLAFDILMAALGGTCTIIHTQGCTYIPGVSTNVTHFTKHMNKMIQAMDSLEALVTSLWEILTGSPWRRQWHPTPVLLPGKSHGQRSLVGCSPWGR